MIHLDVLVVSGDMLILDLFESGYKLIELLALLVNKRLVLLGMGFLVSFKCLSEQDEAFLSSLVMLLVGLPQLVHFMELLVEHPLVRLHLLLNSQIGVVSPL